ncbi:MAG: hypothetical protein ACE14P_12875 [Methanotrichaceae archaeon]
MFKLGDYCEDDAKSIADYLRKAGIKVELKQSIDASIETEEFLQGLFSELKGDIKDKDAIENYERYINATKKIAESKPSPEEFRKKYIDELFPSIDALKAKLKELAEKEEQKKESIEAKVQNKDVTEANDEQQKELTGPGEDTEQADEIQELVNEIVGILNEGENAKEFAYTTLALNEIGPGEDVGGRLDDPVVAIPVDLDDYGLDHPRAKSVLSVYLDKSYELYIDEFSALYSKRLDEEFTDTYTDEDIKITSLNLLLVDLMENHSSEKMDLKTFKDECLFVADSKNRTLKVIGFSVADEIAKALEKNGMIKIKGDTIRWKK